MAKIVENRLSPRNQMRLKRPADVSRELARLYRMSLNRKILPEDLTRYTFALRQLREFLEADAPPQLDNADYVPPLTINVVSVPPNRFVLPDGSFGDAQLADELWTEARRKEANAAALAAPHRPQLKILDPDPDPEPPAAA